MSCLSVRRGEEEAGVLQVSRIDQGEETGEHGALAHYHLRRTARTLLLSRPAGGVMSREI